MVENTKKKKWRRFGWPLTVVVLTYLLLPASRFAHVAARRSAPFERRPVSDALVTAAIKGDVPEMKRLLEAGTSPDANSSGEEGISALSAAASSGSLEAVRTLIEHGADVNDDDLWGGNALVAASVDGHVEIVRLLLDHGSDPNMQDDGTSAIGYASFRVLDPSRSAPRTNYAEIVRMLEAAGADESIIDRPLARLARLIP